MFYLFTQEEAKAAANITIKYLIRNYRPLKWNQTEYSQITGWLLKRKFWTVLTLN